MEGSRAHDQRDFLMGTGLAERLIQEESAGLFSTDAAQREAGDERAALPGGLPTL